MSQVIGFPSTSRWTGQPWRRVRLVPLALLALSAACVRLPGPFDPDPRLEPGFQAPAQTFASWREAVARGDRAGVLACYWPGLAPEEREAYATRDLSPEARALLASARWLGHAPTTPVETAFRFATAGGEELRGVMVRAAGGWRLQHW